jgi:hypothetical protein
MVHCESKLRLSPSCVNSSNDGPPAPPVGSSYSLALLSTFMSTTDYSQFVNDFRQTIVDATPRLRDISPEQSRRKKSADEWAPIEILGHLVDSAANNHQRFVRAQFNDNLVFPEYDQDQWVNGQRYLETSWPELVDFWSLYNLHLAHVLRAISPDALTKTRSKHTLDQIAFKLVDKDEPTTLEYLIRDYVDHLRFHLDQIFSETKSTE